MAVTAQGYGTTSTTGDRLQRRNAALARNWWAVGLRGLMAIAFGAITLIWPGIALLALVLLFAVYMLMDGVLAIVSAVRTARKGERWGFLAFEGVANLAVGVLAIIWPGLTAFALTILIAAWAIVSGGVLFWAARDLDREHGRWWLALGGLASLIFGVLLVFAPIIGAIVLTLWLGAYAVVFGVILLVAAYKLSSHRSDRAVEAADREA